MTLEDISSWLGKLWGLPGYVLVFLCCVLVCKGLRSMARFPNDGVWLVLMLAGAVLNGLIADPLADSFSLRVWLVKNCIFGAVIGGLALLAYNRVLRGFKWFSGDDDRAEKKENNRVLRRFKWFSGDDGRAEKKDHKHR